MDLETWQPGWALLLSLAHPALISLLPLSQGVAKKWVIKGGETVGSVGGGGQELEKPRLDSCTRRGRHLMMVGRWQIPAGCS